MLNDGHRARARTIAKPTPISAIAALFMLSLAAVLASAALADDKIIRSHGYSYYGDLTYPADYEQFSYVNADAPKGGEISISAPGTFDSMNPYVSKGRPGMLSSMVYESLLAEAGYPLSLPADTQGEMYGLLAESLEYDEGKTWVIFHMRPEAKFADGEPVTAHDVVFSHNLFLEQGLKSYAEGVKKRITGAEALDDHRVKFTFAENISRRSLIDQVGSTPVFPQHWYEETGARLDEPRLDAAPGSGPYQVYSVDVNRRIVYERDPDYWGWHLPLNKGRHNFDKIRIEYFADDTAAFEAFKAGEYTFRPERNSKKWATGYDFPAFEQGHVVREVIADGLPPTPGGFVFNLGREKLQDARVRKALTLAYNFEWTNESLQYGLFKQRHSFAQDTHLEAKGLPEGEELAFLKSLGDVVPEGIFEEEAVRAHSSKADRLNDRRNLRKAMKLLDEAGWTVGDDGLRRNAAGEPLTIDLPISSAGSATLSAVVESYMGNLQKMGISANYEKIDPSQFTLRRRERDYDMMLSSYYPVLGTGTGLRQMFGSEAASYSVFNPAGLASPMVDAIIDASLRAESQDEEDVAMIAFDRALRYERFMIPTWYNDSYWVAYWDMYEHPEEMPPYDLGYLDFWWVNEEKAAALKASGALR